MSWRTGPDDGFLHRDDTATIATAENRLTDKLVVYTHRESDEDTHILRLLKKDNQTEPAADVSGGSAMSCWRREGNG